MALRGISLCALIVGLCGCASAPQFGTTPKTTAPVDGIGPTLTATSAPGTESAPPPRNARTVDQFDTTTTAEKQAAAAPVQTGGARLGTTIASLGDPTDPGFWAETGLVREVTQGRLEYPGTGKSVQVELRPSGGEAGSGTRVSLPALRVLEAPLTALPELVVYGS